MKIEEQIKNINLTFSKYREACRVLDAQEKRLPDKYEPYISKVKKEAESTKLQLSAMKEDVLKYYRIAKDNSTNILQSGHVNPKAPDIHKLNELINQINPSNYHDPVAAQVIDLASAYCTYIEAEIAKVSAKESNATGRIRDAMNKEKKSIREGKERILKQCEDYAGSSEIVQLAKDFNTIQKRFEITPHLLEHWTNSGKSSQKLLLGYCKCKTDAPKGSRATLKNRLGEKYDSSTNLISFPYGCSFSGRNRIVVEYNNLNEDKLFSGVQALILSCMQCIELSQFKVSVFDSICFNSSIIGGLVDLTGIKNGIFDAIPDNANAMKDSATILADKYRKIETRLGTSTVSEYNKNHNENERIPYRILIINNTSEPYRRVDNPDLSYIINNAKKLGVIVLMLLKDASGESCSPNLKKQNSPPKTSQNVSIISDINGSFYLFDQNKWIPFEWLKAPNRIPGIFVARVKKTLTSEDRGTKYFDRFSLSVPKRSQNKRKPVSVPFGVDENGNVVSCSFENELFAAYIMGAAGSGKSTMLHTIINGLLMNYHPDELELWLLDFKMLEFKQYASNCPPHVKYVLLEHSEDLVFDIIDQMERELNRRMHIFSKENWLNLKDIPVQVYMPVIFVIIDEFAQMSQIINETKGSGLGSDYSQKIANLLSKGRSFGFKFIFASQTYISGVEGLTEPAREQIQQRIALKNNYQEIKETLSLSSDMITSDLQAQMNALPPYESLFKWRTSSGDFRVDHLRNLYMETNDIDRVIHVMRSQIKPVSSPTYLNKDSCYREKHPILIDGDEPKTFRSQIPYYKSYETREVIAEMDDEDILIYSGVPCSFNFAKPFTLSASTSENILLLGGNRDNELSVVLSILNSFKRKSNNIEIWGHKKNTVITRYHHTVLKTVACVTDLAEICKKIRALKETVLEKKLQNKMIVIFGCAQLIDDMELLAEDESRHSPQKSSASPPEDLASIQKKVSKCTDPAEKRRILEDYNKRVSEYNKHHDDESNNEIYDARSDLMWIVKRGPNYGLHFVFCFEQSGDISNTQIDVKAFHHKLLFPVSQDVSYFLLGSKKGNEIRDGCFMYFGSNSHCVMHPHIYTGIPCNGWMLDKDGSITRGSD